jgi:hypothetical protein
MVHQKLLLRQRDQYCLIQAEGLPQGRITFPSHHKITFEFNEEKAEVFIKSTQTAIFFTIKNPLYPPLKATIRQTPLRKIYWKAKDSSITINTKGSLHSLYFDKLPIARYRTLSAAIGKFTFKDDSSRQTPPLIVLLATLTPVLFHGKYIKMVEKHK